MEIIKYLLEFTFQSVFHFFGVLLLLGVIFGPLACIGSKETNIYYGKKEEKDDL